jgi:hypothetical protein
MNEKKETNTIPVQISIDQHHKYLLKKMIAELTLENPKENFTVTSICKKFINERLIEYQKGQTDDRTDLDVVA